MKTWIYEVGFPVILVLPFGGNEFVATQQPFLSDPLAYDESR